MRNLLCVATLGLVLAVPPTARAQNPTAAPAPAAPVASVAPVAQAPRAVAPAPAPRAGAPVQAPRAVAPAPAAPVAGLPPDHPDVLAQAAPAAPPAPRPPAAVAGRGVGAAPRNIRFDVTISDTGDGKPISKVLTLNVAAGGSASIRSAARSPAGDPNAQIDQPAARAVPLNVDIVRPTVYEDGNIHATVNIEYQPYSPDAKVSLPTSVRASATTVFEPGRKMVISLAADPLTDRRVTVEVTATIVR